MTYGRISDVVARLKKKYEESDPFRLCKAMGIILIFRSMGTAPDAIKGFYFEARRIRTITVNADLPSVSQKIILAHELGHAVLHQNSGVHAFHDASLFDESSIYEKEANLFAAEFLLDDNEVIETLNGDTTFFSAARALYVPMELLDFKFRMMKRKGYKLMESPIMAGSDFLRNMEIPYGE